jgi:hypothetical protein
LSHFSRRRRKNSAIVAGLSVLTWGIVELLDASLRSSQFFTGGLLLFLVIALGLFNVRKKIPFLQLGNATAWMEFHAYAGIFSVLIFFAHIGLDPLHGVLDWSLAVLFMLVAGSGVVGLLLTRLLPSRFNARGEAILFERIPAIRVALHNEVEQLVVQVAKDVNTATIAEFYSARLADFFRKPRNLIFHLVDSSTRFRALEHELSALERYSNDEELKVLGQIHQIMIEKEDLDYRWAQGVALKYWLFVHVPLTYALMVITAAHVLLVLGFNGRIG